MPRDQAGFYTSIVDFIQSDEQLSLAWSMGNDRYVFTDIKTGKIQTQIDVWQFWDDLRSQLGEETAYAVIMGL